MSDVWRDVPETNGRYLWSLAAGGRVLVARLLEVRPKKGSGAGGGRRRSSERLLLLQPQRQKRGTMDMFRIVGDGGERKWRSAQWIKETPGNPWDVVLVRGEKAGGEVDGGSGMEWVRVKDGGRVGLAGDVVKEKR